MADEEHPVRSSSSTRAPLKTTLSDFDFDIRPRPKSAGPSATPERTSSGFFNKHKLKLPFIGPTRAISPVNDTSIRDPVPTDAAGLDGRVNYHLQELGRLRDYVKLFNQIIHEHENRRYDVSKRPDVQDMQVSLGKIANLVEQMRIARDTHLKHVKYHMFEVERMLDMTMETKEADGQEGRVEVKVPEIMKSEIMDVNMWDSLFIF